MPDNMDHEQFLIIRDRDESGQSNGLYIFSGCSHKGIIPVLRYAKEIFPDEKIRCLAAGMHLYSASDEDRQRVVTEVLNENIETGYACSLYRHRRHMRLKSGYG